MQNNHHSRRVREIFPAFLGKVRKETLSVISLCSMPAPPKGELFGIFRKVEQNLPLSGEVASRSDDGEGLLPRSAALSQKAALHLPLAFTTPPVKKGF